MSELTACDEVNDFQDGSPTRSAAYRIVEPLHVVYSRLAENPWPLNPQSISDFELGIANKGQGARAKSEGLSELRIVDLRSKVDFVLCSL